jgi:hypothetical protein
MSAKKQKKEVRKILNISIEPLESTPVDRILEAPDLARIVYQEAHLAIQDAIKSRKKTATLVEVNGSSHFIEIERKDWPNALDQCIQYFSIKEDFELCIQLQEMKSRLEPQLV